jgi:hypothetical protein
MNNAANYEDKFMTTGRFDTTTLDEFGIQTNKYWSGSNGRYVPGLHIKKTKWNTYIMGDCHTLIQGTSVNGEGYCHAYWQVPGFGLVQNFTSFYDSWVRSEIGNQEAHPSNLLWFDNHWSSRDEIRLLSKLLAKVKDHEFNVGVSLAEVDKLAESTVKLVKDVSLGSIDLLTGNYVRFARRFGTRPPHKGQLRKLTATDIPGRFLELQYCWLPTFNDLAESARAFEVISKGPRTKAFRATRQLKFSEKDASVCGFPDRKYTVFRSYLYLATEEMDAYRQMGLGNPLSILWERIPCSFLVDWVIPIGTYLELIGQIPFLHGEFLRTSGFSLSVNGEPRGPFNPAATFWVSSGSIHSSAFWMQRDVVGSLDVPLPDIKVSGAVQGRRVNNAVALGSQIITRAIELWANQKSRKRGSPKVDFNSDYKLVKLSKSILLI